MKHSRLARTPGGAAVLKGQRFDHSQLLPDETCDRANCMTCGHGEGMSLPESVEVLELFEDREELFR
jgi:hypothetical protein